MLKAKIGQSPWTGANSGHPIILCWKDELKNEQTQGCKAFFPKLEALLEANKFKGAEDSLCVLTHVGDDLKVKHFFFVGLGKELPEKHENAERLRRAICFAIKKAKSLCVKELFLALENTDPFGLSGHDLLSQIVICAKMADYGFSEFKSKDKDENGKAPENCELELVIFIENLDANLAQSALEKGQIIGDSVNWARYLADMPPNIATPEFVAAKAELSARECGLETNIFGPARAKELGMGGFMAVQAGSEFDGQFIELVYKSGVPGAKKIAIVGKGVTFDSGGVSLKPANYMKGMKYDMSGAAAVIATILAISKLKPEVDVVALAPMVENMPGGGSCRQDDVIRHYNGMTTEIENTDAEGRLILADALSYAEKKHKPDVIIDLATLTGACVVALGHFFSGLMTNDQKLAGELIEHGKTSGDWLWQLPLHPFYKNGIKSNIADLTNSGSASYGAGSITAGKFLECFVGQTPWAHIDIAGTENAIPDSAYADKLSSGVGVRLLVEFILAQNRK